MKLFSSDKSSCSDLFQILRIYAYILHSCYCIAGVKIVKTVTSNKSQPSEQTLWNFLNIVLTAKHTFGTKKKPKKPAQEPPQKRNSWFCTVLDPSNEMASGNSCGYWISAHTLCQDNCQLIILAINCNHSVSKNNCN